MIKLSNLFETFEQFGYHNEILNVGDGIDLLITNCGGRVYGPFIDGYSMFDWIPSKFEMEQSLRSGHWNIGGERVWLAPEYLFNFEDCDRIIETYFVDASYDPGCWNISKRKDTLVLYMSARIPMTCGRGFVNIEIERSIEAFRMEGELACWRQSVKVCESSRSGLPFIPWLVRQICPGGSAFFSSNMSLPGHPVFGEPVMDSIWPQDGCWNIRLSGDDFYKVSYGRSSVGSGACGYQISNGKGIIYQPILNDESAYPECVYVDGEKQKSQCAAVFYDSGRFGAYGEIELYGHRQGSSGVLDTICYLTSSDLKNKIRFG